MNELSSSMLTTTGIIATLISVLFAIAALVIANRRKKHHQAMQHAVAPVSQAHQGARPENPMAFVAPHPEPLPVAAAPTTAADNLVYDSTRSTSSPLFKRLGRVGVEQVTPSATETTAADSQKAAWE